MTNCQCSYKKVYKEINKPNPERPSDPNSEKVQNIPKNSFTNFLETLIKEIEQANKNLKRVEKDLEKANNWGVESQNKLEEEE